MDCSLPGSSVQGILQARAGVGCLFLLQGIFTTQGSNPRLLRLLHWQAGSLPLHHLGGYERKLSRGSLRISCLLIKTCKQMQLGIQVESPFCSHYLHMKPFPALWKAAQAGAVLQQDSRGPTCPSAALTSGDFPSWEWAPRTQGNSHCHMGTRGLRTPQDHQLPYGTL